MTEKKNSNIFQRFIQKIAGLDQLITQSTTGSIRNQGTKALFGGLIEDADLLFAVKREPASYRVIFMVAQDVWDNGFTIQNLTTPKDTELNNFIQKEFERLKAKYYLTRLTIYERLYGWSILALGFSDYGENLESPLTNPVELKDLEIYSKTQIQRVDEDTESESPRYGLPEYYNLRTSVADVQQTKRLHWTRCIHAATRLIDHKWQGLSALSPIYDDSVAARYIRWSIAIIMLHSGFLDVQLTKADSNKIDAFIASRQFDNLNANKYFVHNENQSLDFKGAGATALNPGNYLQPSMEAISGGTGIPEPILKGAQAGALTGSEVNERSYFKMVSDVQTCWEDILRQLINAILKIKYGDSEIPEYAVKWNPSFELTEEEKTHIELYKSETAKNLTVLMTPDEIRKSLYNLEALPNGQGNTLISPQQGQPGQPSFMVKDAQITDVEQQLRLGLATLLESVKSEKMVKEDALLSAKLLIEDHVRRMMDLTKQRIELKIGRSLNNLSPEHEKAFQTMSRKYQADFKNILEDALGEK
jgi:phage-related protein (TIGR01555 family)